MWRTGRLSSTCRFCGRHARPYCTDPARTEPVAGDNHWMEPAPMMSDDDRLARDLATEAGRRLLALRSAAGDRQSHEFLAGELARLRPEDAVLSEEGRDDPARLSADRVWIVDPLDGTREFGEPGRTDWAVHVALWERDDVDRAHGELTAGAVARPGQGSVLSTGANQVGADQAGRAGDAASGAGRGRGDQRLRVVVSRTRAPRFVRDISDLIDVELVPLGSAGAKVAAVVSGEADAYIHGGGFYEWDTAAPVAVARAAGFHASRIDGSALAYNQADLFMPDILVCRPALAGSLLQAIREVTHAS